VPNSPGSGNPSYVISVLENFRRALLATPLPPWKARTNSRAAATAASSLFGSLAEFERDLIRERTNAGLAAARARGRLGGRPKKLADPKKLALAQQLYDAGQTDIATICRTLGISRATLYRSLSDGASEKE